MSWLSVLQGMEKFEDWTASRVELTRGEAQREAKKSSAPRVQWRKHGTTLSRGNRKLNGIAPRELAWTKEKRDGQCRRA
jgi:hypothetical protein